MSDDEAYTSEGISKEGELRYRNRVQGQIRTATHKHWRRPTDEKDEPLEAQSPKGRFGMPRHVGMRRHVSIPEEFRWTPDKDVQNEE